MILLKVSDVLSKKYFKMEHTLTNGRRADCFLFLGDPHECVAIDSKFAWENYSKLINEKDEQNKKIHAKLFAEDIKKHIKDIGASKQILKIKTAKVKTFKTACSSKCISISAKLIISLFGIIII